LASRGGLDWLSMRMGIEEYCDWVLMGIDGGDSDASII
jgi:hypothetical protein